MEILETATAVPELSQAGDRQDYARTGTGRPTTSARHCSSGGEGQLRGRLTRGKGLRWFRYGQLVFSVLSRRLTTSITGSLPAGPLMRQLGAGER